MSLRARRILAILACVAPLFAPPATAQDRPAFARRIVRKFDFEERTTNPFPVPQHWIRAQHDPAAGRSRPGFPLWNAAELDYSTAFAGEGSVRLPTRGGSTSLGLDTGVIPVFPNADYMVTAHVRTEGLQHARACLRARFLDRESRPIEGADVRSDLVRGEWQQVTCVLNGDHPGAAYVQLEIELLQPQHSGAPSLGKHQIWPEDLAGAAWFDDVTVVQLPRLELRTDSPANVVEGPALPVLRFHVRDLTGEPMRAIVTITDTDGRIVDTLDEPAVSGQERPPWKPRIERYGWYRAALEIRARDEWIGSTQIDFAWLPPTASRRANGSVTRDRVLMGMFAQDIPIHTLEFAASVARPAGCGSFSLPAWDRSLTADSIQERVDLLARAVERLRIDGIETAFALEEVPRPLALDLGLPGDQVVRALGAPSSRPYVQPLLEKFGQTVQRWRTGRIGPDQAIARIPGDALPPAGTTLGSLVPGPVIVAPHAMEEPAPTPTGAGGAAIEWWVFVSYACPSGSLAAMAESWRAVAPPTFIVEPIPSADFGTRAMADDLARRMVELWSSLPAEGPTPRFELWAPWRWVQTRRPQLMPTPALPVWRALSDRLAGRRVVAVLPTPGVRALVLADPLVPAEPAALAIWRESPETAPDALQLQLGDGDVTLVDVFGNASPLAPLPGTGELSYTIPVSDHPMFVEGVDAGLVRFFAGAVLDPLFLPATPDDHEAWLVLTNPWGTRIDGQFYLHDPSESGGRERDRTWRFSPRAINASIGPGETQRIPLLIGFGQYEEAGLKRLIVEADITAARQYRGVRIPVTLEIGLRQVRVDLAYRYARDKASLFVEASIQNTGSEPLTLEVSCFAPEHPRRKAPVSDIDPGETVVRRFAFDAADLLRDQWVSVGVADLTSGGRLNKSIHIE